MKRRNWNPDCDQPDDDDWGFTHPEPLYVDWYPAEVVDTFYDINGDALVEIWDRNPVGFALPDPPQRTELP